MKNLKRLSSVLISLMIFACCKQKVNEDFEGYISYEHKFGSSNKYYNDSSDRKFLGTHSDYYYKDGNYKWLSYDCYNLMDLHLRKDDMNYFLTSKSDTLYVSNSTNPNERILDYKISESKDKILGYSCRILTIRTVSLNEKDSFIWKRDFYFSDEVKMNPEMFKNRNHNSQNFISSKMNSLPLKIVVHQRDRDIIWEATKITWEKLDNSFFQIPENSKFREF